MNNQTEITVPADLHEKIESALRERLMALDLKPGSKKAQPIESSFMSGAMVAINALAPATNPDLLSPAIPPRWVICSMRGASVLDPR